MSEHEVFKILFESDKVLIQEIDSYGHTSERYDQDQDEWVYLVKGEATLQFESETVDLKEGDSFMIHKHEIHQVIYTSLDCKWLTIHFKKK